MPAQYLLYRLLTIILGPVLFGHIAWLSIKNKNRRYFWQRLGFNYSHITKECLWFHCASVGEVNTLLPLLKNLHNRDARLKILITTNTITGAKIVTQQSLDYLSHCYLPFDWWYSVNRFLSTVKPISLHVVETEIWPTLFTACYDKRIPIDIINARLSKKTTSANSWIKAILKYSLSKVSAIYSRSDDNTKAYKQLGAAADIVRTLGNLKFTTLLHTSQSAIKNDLLIQREYVLLASTHQDEEIRFYKIWKKLKRDELLVIAPRHPERCDAIIKQLACKNSNYKNIEYNDIDCNNIAVRNKTNNKQSDTITDQTEIFILNTVGELRGLFQQAKLVIMGGSFTPIGGHNILEPASFNKAIITGPHMENFDEELALMKNKQAIIQVKSYTELPNILSNVLDDDGYRKSLQEKTVELNHKVAAILQDYTKVILAV